MSLIIARSNKSIFRIALTCVVLLAIFFVAFSFKTADAADPTKRLVKIHDHDISTSIVTHADTVAEALKQANISTSPYDNVDPGLSTKLTDTTYQVNVYRAQPVMVVDGLNKKIVMTSYETPDQIAKDANWPLLDEDKTTLSRSDNVIDSNGAGLILSIDRATRFTLVMYGKEIQTGTQAATVGKMLKNKGITLGKDDTLSVPENTPISAGMRVELWRNGKQTITQEEPVAFPVQQIQDASQPVGYKQIKTPGVLGKKVVTYEIEMRNGQELSRKEIQSVQTTAPQQQVEIVGTKPVFSGDFASALAKLRSCEGSYASNTGNGYYGAYQFNASAWRNNAPGEYAGVLPHQAPPAAQDQAAWNYYQKSGWRPWPACSRKLGLPDIYR